MLIEKKARRYDIFVKPLLVLDLNGVLCHRYRRYEVPIMILNALDRHNNQQVGNQPVNDNASMCETANTDGAATAIGPNDAEATSKRIEVRSLYRNSIAHIAGTPIIPRENLDSFLTMLDQSFTLAVWTSAKLNTAKQMVTALIPPAVRSRLMFVWGQNRCQRAQGIVDRRPIFRKPLSKVWDAYPIWNEHNTLMIDDSPEKCPEKYIMNTLHPPAISGLNASAFDSIRKENNLGSDAAGHTKKIIDQEYVPSCFTGSNDVNIKKQETFFRKLVVNWKSSLDDKFLASYLPEFGTGHMGHRVNVKK